MDMAGAEQRGRKDVDRDSASDMDELAHLRWTRLPILGTQAVVIQRDCESASGVANETQLHAGGATITANALSASTNQEPGLISGIILEIHQIKDKD